MAEIEFNDESALDVDLSDRVKAVKEEQGLLYLVKKMHLAKDNEHAEKVLFVVAIACFIIAFGVVLLLFVRPKTRATYNVPKDILQDIQKSSQPKKQSPNSR